MIRTVLALGLLIALGASADAATVHRSKLSAGHPHLVQHVTIPEHAGVPEHYTVPGWTDQETRKWMTFPEVTE
jgi:hypothetical protein